MKLDFKNWTYDGRPLNHPLTILRRLVMTPFLYVAGAFMYLSIMLAYGKDSADDAWTEISNWTPF